MFELLPASRPARRWPLSGGALSLALHLTAVGALIAVQLSRPAPARAGGHAPRRAERVQWVAVTAPVVGLAGGTQPARGAAIAGRRPSAFYVPGKRPAVPRAEATRTALPAMPHIDLPSLDVEDLFFPGFVSSVPDLASRVTRPDDFVRLAQVVARDVARALDADTPYASEDVERLPVPSADNPRPDYPDGFARERVGDTVVVQFVVDTTGAVDPRTVRLLRGTHALFAQAVRAVVPRFRFLPGKIGARAVRVIVQQPFLFRPRQGS